MEKTTENAEKKLLLRMPENLWNKVRKRANANTRSINGEIINIINAAILGK